MHKCALMERLMAVMKGRWRYLQPRRLESVCTMCMGMGSLFSRNLKAMSSALLMLKISAGNTQDS